MITFSPADYEVDFDDTCPACGAQRTHWRYCGHCEDGYIDLGELDWQDEGEYQLCLECYGTGIERWCPECGENLQHPKHRKQTTGDAQ